MKTRYDSMFIGALALLVGLAACDPGAEADFVTEGAQEQAEEDSAAPEGASEAVEMIEVAEGVQRHVTPESAEPTVEFETRTGSYIAIWVAEDGSATQFEAVPADATSALADSRADSPLELFLELAPEGMDAPEALHRGRRFSELSAEAAARLASLPPEQLALMPEVDREAGMQLRAATSCSSSQANDFYNGFRPGVLSSEGTLQYTTSNFQYREARRTKDYQIFKQTGINQSTPTQSAGGLQAAYIRASVRMCAGWGRLTLFRCASSQGTANNGCGEPGSSIHTTFGPFTIGPGGTGTYRDYPGYDLGRARLDQMGSSDLAIWSAMSSTSSWSSIDYCYN